MLISLFQGLYPISGLSQTPATITNRDDAVAIIQELRKIHTPEGIEVLEQVDLGGVPQWISIRGRNRDNPVLLFIHGGPGDPMIGLSWAFQNPWEDYFTVVQWDQRGSGKNAAASDREELKGTFTIEQLVGDAEELVCYLREQLGKEKIVVMAYSMGGILGIHLANRRPEWLHAYVGVGQVSDDLIGALYKRTMEIAVERGNEEAISELEALASHMDTATTPGEDPALWGIWKWANRFDGAWYGKSGWGLYADLPVLSPEYTFEEAIEAWDALLWLNNSSEYELDPRDLRALGPSFQVPILLFHGRFDLTPPIENAQAYLEFIEAPTKRLVTFERSAHVPFIEEPGRFFAALLEHVLPLTQGGSE
ncbi:alpha/beta fold hydrolase [Cyclobacterium salsum]|uniref:alpha/beta fold hydrolase n=1 Tax=Cyclobacterium salsum TaxID=2666329 RepID=UPI0021D3680C|nr:alpha/beta hydrolase [Cyclobacterium salsum]